VRHFCKIKKLFKLFEVFIMTTNVSRKNIRDFLLVGLGLAANISGGAMMYFAKALAKAIRYGVGGALAGVGTILVLFPFVIIPRLSGCECCNCSCGCSKDDSTSEKPEPQGDPLTEEIE
jgi:hypothetical protein